MRLVSASEVRLQVILVSLLIIYNEAFQSHRARGWTHPQRNCRGRTLTAISIMDEPTFHPPAALRNRGPILSFLQSLSWPDRGTILEAASGTGAHVGLFAGSPPFTSYTWQPTDYEAAMMPYIAQEIEVLGLKNVEKPVALDVRSPPDVWPCAGPGSLDAVLAINLIHISPYECCLSLIRACGVLLKPGGRLITYGPYKCDGILEPESNVAFDMSLRARNPEWGIRELNDLRAEAEANGLELTTKQVMPANNYALVFTRV